MEFEEVVCVMCRLQITHRETLATITELTGAAVTTRGIFIMPRAPVPEGERKLALLIQVRSPARALRLFMPPPPPWLRACACSCLSCCVHG